MNFKPAAKAEMLIRKPVAEVFEAFVDPAITTRFWFSESSGRLDEKDKVIWQWGTFQLSVEVQVKALEKDRRILIEWTHDKPTSVEWTFTNLDGSTFVSVVNTGFEGTDEEILNSVVDATEGFALVLVGCKAWLEHGLILNLISDRFPEALPAATDRRAARV